MTILRRTALEIIPSLFGIDCLSKHALPSQSHSELCSWRCPNLVPRNAPCQIGSMCGNLRSHDAVPHVLQIRQAEMLCRCDIAQEIRTAHGSNGTADRSCDVVISRSNICYQRPQHIERTP